MIGMIIPTRSRPESVQQIINAWHETGAWGAAYPLFVIDSDDARLDDYRRALDTPELTRGYIEAGDWQPMVPKLNVAAYYQTANYPVLGFMGDDHRPRTELWAQSLLSLHTRRPGHVAYGRDGLQDQALPTWWTMDSRIVKALGNMVPAPVQHMYCDNAIKEMAARAERLVYMPDILIEHMHPIAEKAPWDSQYRRVNRPEQYERDRSAFVGWLSDGLARDAKIMASVGR